MEIGGDTELAQRAANALMFGAQALYLSAMRRGHERKQATLFAIEMITDVPIGTRVHVSHTALESPSRASDS